MVSNGSRRIIDRHKHKDHYIIVALDKVRSYYNKDWLLGIQYGEWVVYFEDGNPMLINQTKVGIRNMLLNLIPP